MAAMMKHIVLIENDEDFRWVLTLMLENLGCRVTSFSEVDDIKGLISSPADLYLVDENLPGINGHTLCIILKSQAATRDVPLVLISGSEHLMDMALLSNADYY